MSSLSTERLHLSPFTADDVDPLHALWIDEGVRRYLWDDIVIERSVAEEVVNGSIADWATHGIGMFVVRLRGDDGIIGFCGLRRFGDQNEWELLYGFFPEFWGRGLALEASRAVLDVGFSTLPVDRIGGRTDSPNAASIRVLEKLGMQYEGEARATVTYWMHRLDPQPMTNTQVLLAARPVGFPKESDFNIVTSPVPTPGDGEFLVEMEWLSLDPYMRGRMSDAKSYAEPVKIGDVMTAGTVGKVIESKHPSFASGDYVTGQFGWQLYAASDGRGVRKIDSRLAPVSTALGVLGMPGLTAYFGLLEIGRPKPGETVVVSGAAGAVGSYVGQIAKIQGCRVVGIAGTDDKIRHITEDLGFDAAFNYHTQTNYRETLAGLCPNGIDVYFDNVGGDISDAVFSLLNTYARVSICGQIALYNLEKPDMGPRLLPLVLTRQLKVEGFIVSRFLDRAVEGLTKLAEWVASGRLKYREDIAEGLENAPRAFIGMLRGQNTGKQLVKLR